MKRTLYIFVCLTMVATSVCNARVVPESSAKKIAESFFASNPQTKASASSLKLLWDGLEKGPSTKSFSLISPFYVYGFDGEEGFVIVSGDDICRPILGFSYKGSFDPDNIPDGMRDWFDMVRSMVNEGEKKNLSATVSVSEEWERTTTKATDYNVSKQLETARWNQGAPYNLMSPVLDESKGHTCTGCVNTATAIVMKYWSYPEAGTGTLDSYEYYSYDGGPLRTQAGHSLGHKYEWDKMLMKYSYGAYTTEQGNAVATLMYDLGIMNKSCWGYSGTGAIVHNQQYIEHMGYDKDMITGHIYDFTSISQWYSYLKKEIDEGRPVLYSGFRETSGHQFVLDGYAANDYFSFNWGWGGESSFYTIDPSSGNKDLMDYIDSQEAVLGMKPDDEIDNPIDYPISISSPSMTDLAYAIRNKQEKFSFQCFAYQGRQNPIKKKLRLALMRDSKVVKYLTEDIECTIQEDNGHSVRLTSLTADTFTDFSRGDYICIGYVGKDGNWVTCGGENGMIKLEKETTMMNITSLSELLKLFANGADNVRLENVGQYTACVDICRGSELLSSILPIRSSYLDTYWWKGSELTVTIYDLFESYDMTIKL